MTSRSIALGFIALLLSITACRFVDLTPGGSRRDDGALQSLAAAFYAAIGRRNAAALEASTLPAATALLAADAKGSSAVLVGIQALIQIPERRNDAGGARIVRVELRTDGEVGSERVVIAAKGSDGQTEYEATDVLTVAHREGRWRVAHATLGPWHVRSAP